MAQTEYFNFFPFLSSGMADYFQISKMKIQNFSFPCGGMANFFQHFKISKMNSFQMFHGGINEKKSTQGYQIYLIYVKVTYLTLPKIAIYCISLWWYHPP
jgi:hypothetical protein